MENSYNFATQRCSWEECALSGLRIYYKAFFLILYVTSLYIHCTEIQITYFLLKKCVTLSFVDTILFIWNTTYPLRKKMALHFFPLWAISFLNWTYKKFAPILYIFVFYWAIQTLRREQVSFTFVTSTTNKFVLNEFINKLMYKKGVFVSSWRERICRSKAAFLSKSHGNQNASELFPRIYPLMHLSVTPIAEFICIETANTLQLLDSFVFK